MERSRGEGGVRGQRGEGAPRLRAGASRRGPQRSGLPFQPGWGHASPAPAPTPPPGTPPQGGSGEIPSPGDFQNSGVWAARTFPEPWRPPSPAPRTVTTACLPHRLCPGTQARGGPAPRLFSPEPASPVPGSRLSWHPDIAGHPHPALIAQTDNLGTKRRQPKVSGPGTGAGTGGRRHPLPKSEAPQSTHMPRDSQGRGCGGAWRPERGGERKRRREGSREIRRQEGREEGGRGGGKEGAEEEGRRQRPGGRAGGGDRFV